MIPFLDLKKLTCRYQPEIDHAVKRVVDSGNYIRGREVGEFEKNFASYIATRHCVGVGNGFDALRLIFKAWMMLGELSDGDEVIVPSNTYIATILAVSDNRLVPIFVEPDIGTFNLDPARIAEKITARTKAILLVHLYGRNAMDTALKDLADKYRLKVVEDNAQAVGCCWQGRRTGSLGHAAAHSFFPTKNLGALGDGGAVTTDDTRLADMIRTLGNYGSHAKGINDVPGVNSRLDELQAAVLNVKLPRLQGDNVVRQSIARRYHQGIRNPAVLLPALPSPEDMREHVWHLFVVRCKNRERFQEHMTEEGIGTLIHYPIPPHRQGAFKSLNEQSFPVADTIHREVLSLPLNPALDDPEIQRVIEAVNGFKA